jgi:hypothetical protein
VANRVNSGIDLEPENAVRHLSNQPALNDQKVDDTMTTEQLRELAKSGAELTLRRLRAEIIAIERAFPELALPRRRRAVRRAVKEATRRTRRMSAAARKAVSVRMKKYWAERKKAQAKVKS